MQVQVQVKVQEQVQVQAHDVPRPWVEHECRAELARLPVISVRILEWHELFERTM